MDSVKYMNKNCDRFGGLPIDRYLSKWFYECMTAKKVMIAPRLKVEGFYKSNEVATDNEVNVSSTGLSKSPVVKSSLKGLIDQVFQFVSVGGDFV